MAENTTILTSEDLLLLGSIRRIESIITVEVVFEAEIKKIIENLKLHNLLNNVQSRWNPFIFSLVSSDNIRILYRDDAKYQDYKNQYGGKIKKVAKIMAENGVKFDAMIGGVIRGGLGRYSNEDNTHKGSILSFMIAFDLAHLATEMLEGIENIPSALTQAITTPDKQNKTPLLFAILKRRIENTKESLIYRLTVKDIIEDEIKLITKLIDLGSPLDTPTNRGDNIFHILCYRGDFEILRIILEKADKQLAQKLLNAKNDSGKTPLEILQANNTREDLDAIKERFGTYYNSGNDGWQFVWNSDYDSQRVIFNKGKFILYDYKEWEENSRKCLELIEKQLITSQTRLATTTASASTSVAPTSTSAELPLEFRGEYKALVKQFNCYIKFPGIEDSKVRELVAIEIKEKFQDLVFENKIRYDDKSGELVTTLYDGSVYGGREIGREEQGAIRKSFLEMNQKIQSIIKEVKETAAPSATTNPTGSSSAAVNTRTI